jgi:hypothetical protein
MGENLCQLHIRQGTDNQNKHPKKSIHKNEEMGK